MISTVLIFSFIFEAIFTKLVNTTSFLIPLFTLTSLIMVYPYFNKKNVNYILVCLILGLFYDIVFADSIFVNTVSFGLVGALTMLCYNYIKCNVYSSSIVNLIMLITYRIISYIILLSINYITFNNRVFFSGIYKSLIVNIIYGILLYSVIEIIARKFNKKRVE